MLVWSQIANKFYIECKFFKGRFGELIERHMETCVKR